MSGVLGLAAAVLALCPTAEDVRAELAKQSVVLAAEHKIVIVERDEVIEVAFFRGEQQFDAHELEGPDCAALTRSAAAFVAGWSVELSLTPDAPPRRALDTGPRRTRRLRNPPKFIDHRITVEALAAFSEPGIGFHGTLDYALRVGPTLFLAGGFADVSPDVVLLPGIVSRSTFGGAIGLGLEGTSPVISIAGVASALFAGSIVAGRGFDVSGTVGIFEPGARISIRVRWPALPLLPGLSFSGVVWPLRDGAIIQGISMRSDASRWELCVGLHLAIFP
ncbi:MAG: hypothetical protein JNM17_00585 [Archangium sp.]|nr:hypothetical protein [Archangium sp.]